MTYDAVQNATIADNEAPGVAYTTSERAPGLKLFRCERIHATLSTKACATRWSQALATASPAKGPNRKLREARREIADRLAACRACSLGSAHAGQGLVRYSRLHGMAICPRCGVGTTRMIGNRRCVSCYNREREMRAGKNARGNRPVELLQRPLRTVEILLDVDGEVRRHRDSNTRSLMETVVQVLRTTRGEISFGFAGGAQGPAVVTPAEAGPTAVSADAEPEHEELDYAGSDDDESDADYVWLITENHCEACGGRVLRHVDDAGVHRCADCGASGEGMPDGEPAEAAAESASEATGRDRPASYAFRIRLFAGTAVVPAVALVR